MAPAKSSRNLDDHKPEPGAKEKNGGHTSTKMRRGASQTSASQQREAANAPKLAVAPTSAPAPGAASEAIAPSLQWSSFERDALHLYRRQHQLSTPSSYVSSFHKKVLSRPGGIGLHSPTMLRKKNIQRQTKEQLALAVRKHFNGLGIQENDVIVDFIYKIRSEKNAALEGPNKQRILTLD